MCGSSLCRGLSGCRFGCCGSFLGLLDDFAGNDFLVAAGQNGLNSRIEVEGDDLVAECAVLIGFENTGYDVFAVTFEIRDERRDVALAVDEEETVDVGELGKSGSVDNLTEVEFAFSLLGRAESAS